jgi:glutamyl-tRNA reductase
LLTRRALESALGKRSDRPLWLIDLGFPRNIDPRCALLEGVTLVDLDDLAPWGWQPLPPAARARAEVRIREETGRLLRLLAPVPEPDVARFRKAVERARRDEVDRALGRLPRLSPDERIVIDKLASRLVNRFLHAPTEWLRTLPEELAAPTVAELVHRLQSPSGR